MNRGTNRGMNSENNPGTNGNERNRQRDTARSNQEENQENLKKLTNMKPFSWVCPRVCPWVCRTVCCKRCDSPFTAAPEPQNNRNAPNPSQNNETKSSDDVQSIENATIDTQLDVIFSQYSYLSIFAALESGNMDKAKALIPLYPECLITSRPSDGMTLLTSCACAGRTDACRLLLNQGVDVNQKAKGVKETRETTAIIMACFGGHFDVVQLLLSVNGIQVNQSKKNGTTPLFIACQRDCMKVVNALLAREEIQINQAMKDGATPLFVACQKDRVKVVNALLVRKEIQINQAMNNGATPLHVACQNDHVKVVNALLARKEIQINQANNNGATPLYIACQEDRMKVVKALLTNKEIDIDKPFEGWTPLKKAIQKGHTEIAALLQQHGTK